MNGILLGVVVAALLVAALARRFGLPSPLILVVVGLIACQIPGVPALELDPDLVLFVVLPPLLYSAALDSSYLALRSKVRPIGLLAVGLPLVTTAAVGVVAYLIVPEFSLAAALVLGAIVAPPDAVSASAIGRKLGLPRRIMTLLGGESLLNDATALTAYRVALAAAVGTGATLVGGFETFVVAAVGGTVIGLVVGLVISRVRGKLKDPLMESGIGLVVPFFTYLAAEEVHASGVIAVVVAGLVLGQRSTRASYATRLQDTAVWRAVDLILESFVFLLIGLQLPSVVEGLQGYSVAVVVWASAGVLVTVVLVRIAWVFPATYVPRWVSPRIRAREPQPSPRSVFIVSWAGMRGVVSLAAAFAIPLTVNSGEDFPGRSLILFLTFVVVVGTLLLHGLTLPWVIRTLGVHSDESQSDARAEAAAQDRAARAASARLDELVPPEADDIPAVRRRAAGVLRHRNTSRANSAWERLGRSDADAGESPSSAMRALRLEMIEAEREVFVAERDAGRIDDEVLRRVLRELDLEEAALDRD
ncbi:Na+/H+ antiporter [Rhodococcus sp. 27YEA15]|uniref:Na+/H+ antiporter n=1 Tax=Rhodococcus sp. 27YEA15 TaxID=3156259 RepID=UPI003C7D8F39